MADVKPPTAELESHGQEAIEEARRIVDEAALGIAYQPIYALKTGTVFGFEVLSRSSSRILREIPDLFTAAAAAGRVGELGRLCRTQAIRSAPSRPLFVNVHPAEFDQGWLVRPDDPLFRHKHEIYLEITESVPLSHFEQCSSVLSELRTKGMKVAVDDLGAGFSNLKYISDLAPDIVKLDRELIQGIRDGSRQFRLFRSIVQVCHEMGAEVVAEGIETVEELVVAELAGVEYCQGYLLGRPELPARENPWPAFKGDS